MTDEHANEETLAEIRARLELDGPPMPPDAIQEVQATEPAPEALDPHAPPVPRAKRTRRRRSPTQGRSSTQRSSTPRTSTQRRGPARALVVVVTLVAMVAVAIVLTATAGTHGKAKVPIPEAWKHYPGTYYADSADVLAAPSKEAVIAEADAVISEYQQALTTQFGLAWSKEYDSYAELADNDYGGKSMLYTYWSPEWQGSAVIDDPAARKKAYDLFTGIVTGHGADDIWRVNDVYLDDSHESRERFGGTTLSTQLEWDFYGDGAVAPLSSVSVRVLDLNVHRDPAFDGADSFDLDAVPPGSLVVELSVSAHALLATSDRTEFKRRIATYNETAKPEPH